MSKIAGLLIIATLLPVIQARAQHEHHQHGQPAPPKSDAPQPGEAAAAAGHQHNHADGAGSAGRAYLLRLASGTSLNPASWPMPMVMHRAGSWDLMWMGQAFLVATQQSGPRGADKIYSANWGMLAAARDVGRGTVMVRGMISLDPITVRGRRYPLLFQTGESAYGTPIVDGQHPHDLLMELSVHYARPLGEKALFNGYYAPVGDAALGPVAFPHRASAMEIPQATLGHHWQDATHIANNVVTAGITYGPVRLEASGFRGREPNENRWNIDMGPMDSWSGRVTLQPGRNWVAQVSAGRIRRPEVFHADDVVRATASVHYTKPMTNGSAWSSSVIWARNYKTIGRYATNSLLAESVVPVTQKNWLTSRVEWSQRDELFEYDHDLAHEMFDKTGRRHFNVGAWTVGYTRDITTGRSVRTGVGFNFTTYAIASALKPFYGDRPIAASVFLRIRLEGSE